MVQSITYKLKEMLSNFKDADRFEKYISILQERVPWDDPILLPAGLHLYIVQKQNGKRIVKCDCGHEFCDEKDNWKMHALIHVRDTEDKMTDLYPKMLLQTLNGRLFASITVQIVRHNWR